MLRKHRIISSDRYLGTNLTDTSRPIAADTSRPVAANVFDYRFDDIGNRLNSSAYTVASNEKFLYDGWAERGSAEMAQALLASAGPNGRAPLGRTFGNLVAIYNAASGNALLKTHTWGLDLSRSLWGAGGVGGLLGVKEHSGTHAGTYHFAYAANGNVTEVLKKNPGSLLAGGLAAHYEYDPFGNAIRSTGAYAAANPFRFSTKYWDSETTPYYYGYRHYDPATGRWPSRDPIEERGGINLYGFVGNSPINFWDNLGMQTSNCTSVSFSVSRNLATRAFNTGIPFIFAQVSGDVSLSISGQKCDECCPDGTTADYYDVSVSVSGSATLTVTAGIALSERYSGFKVDVWGDVQGSGGGSVSGSGSFSKGCSGPNGSGTGVLSGTAGLRVGAEASFRVGRWSLRRTGVSGGGSSTVSLPFNFVCTDSDCESLTWGNATGDASLSLRACVLGFCFNKNF